MADEQNPAVITFTSDFGTKDGYVGIVKGVMLSINGTAQLVDISHNIEPFNIGSAAWIIYNAHNHFTGNAIHVVVVDPGVGSSRRGVLIEVGEQKFIGPDNGVFSLILEDPLNKRDPNVSISAFELKSESNFYAPAGVSNTFHARDVYARVAAHASLGVEPEEFSKSISRETLVVLDTLSLVINETHIRGRVAHIDHFGNLISNIPSHYLTGHSICFVDDQQIGKPRTTYQSVSKGELVALRGSHGFLEIACCEGRADSVLGAHSDSRIVVQLK